MPRPDAAFAQHEGRKASRSLLWEASGAFRLSLTSREANGYTDP